MAIRPGKYDPIKPDIELFDFKSKKRYGLKLEGSGGLQVGTISQDDSVHIRAAGKVVGDFDEQRSWRAGRGAENLSENPEGFWDSKDMWTMTDGHLYPTLLQRFGRGIRTMDLFMPDKTHSVTWQPLLGTQRFIETQFVSGGITCDYVRVWVRKIGNPGSLVMSLYNNSSGSPGSLIIGYTVLESSVDDFLSQLVKFDFASTVALSIATDYHIGMEGSASDNAANHWEVGVYQGGTNSQISNDGSSWNAATFDLYYGLFGADVSRKFFTFFIDEAMYVVDKKASGASQVWINGDRGKATSVTVSTLSDSGKSWATNRWQGAWVKIVRGTGLGTTAEIQSNTGTQLTIVGTFTIDTTSEYIIYATEWFTEVSTSGLATVTGTPAVINQIAYFPQGSGTNIRRMIWNATAHQFSDDGTNKADFIVSMPSSGITYVVAALSVASTVAVAPSTPFAGPPAALVFGTARVVGSTSYKITNLLPRDGTTLVYKESGISYIDQNLNVVNLQTGMEKTPFAFNGAAVISHQQFVFYTWQHSLMRIYGTSHDDVGQDWSGNGLPDGREGYVSSLDAYTSLLMVGVNAGAGTSSVLGFDGIGWHEIMRGFAANEPMSLVKVQVCEGTRNRTWAAFGDNFIFQEMPYLKGSPRLDSGVRYQHEGVIESAAIDMGTAAGLAKFIKELTVFCRNMDYNGNEIFVDYQTDEDVHTNKWTPATKLLEEPESVAFLGLENIRKMSYRLRIYCGNNAFPPDISGVTPNGYARVPFKLVWTLRCRADNITSRGRLAKPEELMRWLLDSARYPSRIIMLSQYALAHKFFVIIHPPRMFPYKPANDGQQEESVFTIVLEEA